jgi:hypothetical protein
MSWYLRARDTQSVIHTWVPNQAGTFFLCEKMYRDEYTLLVRPVPGTGTNDRATCLVCVVEEGRS